MQGESIVRSFMEFTMLDSIDELTSVFGAFVRTVLGLQNMANAKSLEELAVPKY
jgi:hypothetical protein